MSQSSWTCGAEVSNSAQMSTFASPPRTLATSGRSLVHPCATSSRPSYRRPRAGPSSRVRPSAGLSG
eukprot:11230631-Alexandrium_andersonii.AAC.1